MDKLFFVHGTMGSGKTLDLIRNYHNYIEQGLTPVCIKPTKDTRSDKIASRTGNSIESLLISEMESIIDLLISSQINIVLTDIILIDEAQFLTASQVNELLQIVHDFQIPVVCYGLKNNFRSELFEGSKRLLEVADNVSEIKSVCWCGNKASQNARVVDGKIITSGEEVQIGGNESYIPLCTNHFLNRKINKNSKGA